MNLAARTATRQQRNTLAKMRRIRRLNGLAPQRGYDRELIGLALSTHMRHRHRRLLSGFARPDPPTGGAETSERWTEVGVARVSNRAENQADESRRFASRNMPRDVEPVASSESHEGRPPPLARDAASTAWFAV